MKKQSMGLRYVTLAMADAFVYMCPAVYATFLSAFYTQKGLTGTQTGILFGVSPIMYILIQPLWARLADRTGRRRDVLAVICLGCAASLICFYPANAFAAYLAAVVMLSVFSTAVTPLSDSIILMEANECGFPFAGIRLFGTVGYIIIVGICGRVFTAHPDWMFACASAMYVLYALMTRMLPNSAPARADRERRPKKASVRPYIRGEFIFMLLYAFCGYVGLSFCTTYTGAYLVKLGYGQSTIATASMLSALSEIPALLFLRRASGKISPLKMMAFACMMTGLRALLTGTGLLPCIFAAQLLQSVSYMLMYYCGVMFISEHFPEELQSSGQSLVVLVQSGCGSMVGFLAGGRLIDVVGIGSGCRIYGAATILGAALIWTVHWALQSKEKRQG